MTMSRRDLEQMLRRWGIVFGPRKPSEWDEERSPYPAPLAQAAEFAPGKADRSIADQRDGRSRRLIAGRAAGLLRQVGGEAIEAAAPMWSSDPVRGTQTRGGRKTWDPDPVAERVEVAWLDLYACERLQAIVLRCEYCLRGIQPEKCDQAAGILCQPIKLRRYRLELDYARAWMFGRLAPSRDKTPERAYIGGTVR